MGPGTLWLQQLRGCSRRPTRGQPGTSASAALCLLPKASPAALCLLPEASPAAHGRSSTKRPLQQTATRRCLQCKVTCKASPAVQGPPGGVAYNPRSSGC
eukprot:361965-Chlamydomonas_euryale.AAC.3